MAPPIMEYDLPPPPPDCLKSLQMLEVHKPSVIQQFIQEGYTAGEFHAFPVITTARCQPRHDSLPFTVFKGLRCSVTENGVHRSFTKGIAEAIGN